MSTSIISEALPRSAQPSVPAFLLRAAAWIVGLFAFVRIPWVQEHLLIPFAQLQHGAACALTGAPRDAVVVDLSCTGADVMAVTLGALLSFPMPWKRRLLGAGLGLGLLIALNTVRIGTLSWVVGNRDLFDLLHLRVLPMMLVLAATAFVLFWIRRPAVGSKAAMPRQVLRPLAWVLGFTALYFLLAPTLYSSDLILRWAQWITAGSARVMHWLGLEAAIHGNVLTTANGGWRVTQECVLTPLMPAYLGLAWAMSRRPRSRMMAVLGAFPLFSALGAARLMVLALPASLIGDDHFVAIHSFYQVLVAILAIVGASWLRGRLDRPSYLTPAWATAIGLAVGLAVQAIEGGRLLASAGLTTADPQGVLTFIPAFMIGLFTALTLTLGGRRLAVSLAAALGLVLIGVGLRWSLGTSGSAGFALHPLLLRAIAIALPTATAWWLQRRPSATSYQDEWTEVGNEFPDLGGATSTGTYRRDEQLLISEALPDLGGVRLFKTDLWDEARNSRILQWAAGEGAEVFGIDISLPTVLRARSEFRRQGLTGALCVADVREIPFVDGSFEAAYSMGTVEHFHETDTAVGEIRRVVGDDGCVVLGVPNRRDPFLRPLLVGALQAFGLYAYGDEKCYSHRQLQRLCLDSGLHPQRQGGILFQPGSLRMLDLALHTRIWSMPGLAPIVGLLLRPFAALSGRFAWLRRHGYLIAAVATPRPGSGTKS